MKDYRGQQFDPEALLAALPYRRLIKPPAVPAIRLREWRWPRMQAYNGFTHEQRVMTWQIGWYLREAGAFKLAPACDICGTSKRLGYHSEDYADLERSPTVCSSCHAAIHKRFYEPALWQVHLNAARCKRSSPQWIDLLPAKNFDLAAWLTAQAQNSIDIRLRLLSLSEDIRVRWPRGPAENDCQ
jgi:hypothetical protein